MTVLPEFQIGLLNGWLAILLYTVGLVLSVLAFSNDARDRLFEDPKFSMSSGIKILRAMGQIGLITCIVMMVFTPLRFGTLGFVIGVLLYIGGYIMVIGSLNTFRTTPVGQPVVSGFYRWSRNPQWVGLALIMFAAALMTGILLYMGIILCVALIYHQQILGEEKLCLAHYGDSYREYMTKVPRYLFLHRVRGTSCPEKSNDLANR